VGGIGCSTGTAEEDQVVAQGAIDYLLNSIGQQKAEAAGQKK
jgi:hypothetical protein